MAPGDIVLAHQKLAHRISFNHSPFIRYQVYNCYLVRVKVRVRVSNPNPNPSQHVLQPQPLHLRDYQVYFRIGAEGRRPEAPLRAGGTYDNFVGLASVTAAGPLDVP